MSGYSQLQTRFDFWYIELMEMNESSPNNPNQTLLIIIVIMFIGLLGIAGYFIYQKFQLQQQLLQLRTENQSETGLADSGEKETTPVETQPTQAIDPTEMPTNTPDPYQGWETYTNQEYGFQISYPSNYQALDDENNLYGWPNAIVLLYKGGQAYDLPIEVWDTEAEYQEKNENSLDKLIVKEVNGKYITFFNSTTDGNFQKIVNSFKKI